MSYGIELVQSQGSQILPYIAWFNNRELFQNDIMGLTFPYYAPYSLWYPVAGIIAGIIPAAVVLYIYFFVQCFVEVFGLRFLARKLFPKYPDSFSWIIILLFTFGGVLRHSLGSVAPFGWTVFPDTLATGLLLFALGYFFDKRYLSAFIIIAISFYVHLSLTLFVFSIIFIIYLSRIKNIPPIQIFKTGLIFSILVIPLGLRILFNPIPPLTSSLDLWMSSIKNFQGMHAFPSQFGAFQYIPFFFWVVPFVVSFRYIRDTEQISNIKMFCGVATLLLVVTAFFTEIIPIKTVITLSFFRGSRFILIPAVFCTIALLFKIYNRNTKKFIYTGGIGFAVFFIIVNITVFHPIYRIYPDFVKSYIERINSSDSSIKGLLLYQTVKNDREYVLGWIDVQTWSRNNTPEDKLILTPYYLRGFRTYSDRGIVFDIRGLNHAIYFPVFEETNKRMIDVGFDWLEYDNLQDATSAVEKLYKSYKREDVRELSKRLGFEFIVTETEHQLEFELKYRNKYFNVYKIETKQ